MTRKDATDAEATDAEAAAAEAARRFVRADAGERGADAELAAWLEERPENERALERVELAAILGRRLAADPSSALHADAARAARLAHRRAWRRAAAWGAASASLLVAVAVVRDAAPRKEPDAIAIEAARVATFDAPTNAAAVLPSGAVVDAGAVAVLPFRSGDATLAEGLERDVVEALRTVPGLYVVGDAAVAGYAATDLGPSELGAQLGVRGIVDAGVELVHGRVRVNARLRDAATGATLWLADVDRPVDELRTIRQEIAENVAATMLDSSLREQAARADRSSAAVSVGKPMQR